MLACYAEAGIGITVGATNSALVAGSAVGTSDESTQASLARGESVGVVGTWSLTVINCGDISSINACPGIRAYVVVRSTGLARVGSI